MQNTADGFDTTRLRFVLRGVIGIATLIAATWLSSRAAFGLPPFDLSTDEARAAALFDEELARIRSAREARLRAAKAAEHDRNRILEPTIVSAPSIREHVPEKGKFIGIDLAAMSLSLYEDGARIASYPVLSKGRPGSHWETPTGSYTVLMKSPNHFSSIGDVFMPQSMQFFGNFFIHGWPYYPGGTPVEQGYSGGCVRLASEDAERVFAFAERGTPIFLEAAGGATAARPYDVRVRNHAPPPVSARAFIVADVASGAVFAERRADRAMPIASITKLMTAVVANETISFDRPITILDPHAEGAGDYGSVRKGDELYVGDALYPLLLESNNAVAHALARSLGEDEFLAAMNAKAAALGMRSAHFADSSGISSQSRASAADLVALARYLATSKSFILEMTRTKTKEVRAPSGSAYTFASRNRLVAHEFFLGGKTGFTEDAGETMFTLFDVPVGGGRATSTLAVVVLGSSDREGDTKALLSWFRGAAVIQTREVP